MMKSALLFYRKLVAELCNLGFEINPYNSCIANKMVNGTQVTVRWLVDDLMISHTSQDNIMAFVKKIKIFMVRILQGKLVQCTTI
jgi:hypothetical protein